LKGGYTPLRQSFCFKFSSKNAWFCAFLVQKLLVAETGTDERLIDHRSAKEAKRTARGAVENLAGGSTPSTPRQLALWSYLRNVIEVRPQRHTSRLLATGDNKLSTYYRPT